MTETIALRLTALHEEIAEAARASGRDPASVKLVLVTKFVEPVRMLEAYAAGARDFGENRVQEFSDKREVLPRDIAWHLIGTLQTNKVKEVVGQAALIHSLDRPELAQALETQAAKRGVARVPCLVQVNTSGEASKSGFEAAQVAGFLKSFQPKAVQIRGLMTIAPLTGEVAQIRGAFRRLRELRDQLRRDFPAFSFEELSMGMTHDFRSAIEEGSTLVRVGSYVFGPRPEAPSGPV